MNDVTDDVEHFDVTRNLWTAGRNAKVGDVQNAVREQIARTLDTSMLRRLTFEVIARRFVGTNVSPRRFAGSGVDERDVRRFVDAEVDALVASIRARSTVEVNVMTSTVDSSLPTKGAQYA